MIAKTLIFFVLGAALIESGTSSHQGVDPNTLSCDPEGKVFLLLPHYTDCSKFYMCSHGKEVEHTCSAGTIFDFELQTCNWPTATKCWLRAEEDDLDGSGEGSGDLEWTEEENQHEAKPESPKPEGIIASLIEAIRANRRPADEVPTPENHFTAILDCNNARDAARLVPYNADCQRFWRCSDGLPVSAYCSDGLFFNAQTQQCDFEANVKCAVQFDEELQGEFIVY